MVLRTEPRAYAWQVKSSTPKLHSWPSLKVLFWDSFNKLTKLMILSYILPSAAGGSLSYNGSMGHWLVGLVELDKALLDCSIYLIFLDQLEIWFKPCFLGIWTLYFGLAGIISSVLYRFYLIYWALSQIRHLYIIPRGSLTPLPYHI